MKPRAEIVQFSIHGDDRGCLIALEGGRDIPFEVRRVYYIYGTRLQIHSKRRSIGLTVNLDGNHGIAFPLR